MKKYPFKFLDAYNENDTDIFFGRDDEIKVLYEMAFQNPILLVYGASGTGKTSLIQCGLAGRFKSYEWLPLTIRRGSDINESLERVLANAGGNIKSGDDEVMLQGEKQLSGFSKLIKNIYLNNFKPVYLIFDQFEELYILSNNKEEEKKFIESVKEILLCEQPVKLIFSIREEYLGYLYDFERAVPQLLRKKLRVEPMTIDKLTEILKGINNYKKSNVLIKTEEIPNIADEIFAKLTGKRKNQHIELPYLQVFLDKLYMEITADEARQKEAMITMETLHGIGDIGDVLRDFLESQVKSISDKINSAGSSVSIDAIWQILSPFSTLEGTKEPLLIKELKARVPKNAEKFADACVAEFKARRILKVSGSGKQEDGEKANSDDLESAERFELAHDSLAKCIAAKRSDEEIALLEVRRLINNQLALKGDARAYFNEKQLNFIEPQMTKLNLDKNQEEWIEKSRAQVDFEKNEKERLQKKKLKNARIIASVISVLGIIAVGVMWYAIIQTRYAKASEHTAQAAKDEAYAQRDSAQKSLLKAYQSDSARLEKEISMNGINLKSFKNYGADPVVNWVNIKMDSLNKSLTNTKMKMDSLAKMKN